MTATVLLGDCLEVMKGMEAESFDAIVTDPPYGLEFMGKTWDSFDGKHGWKTGAGFSKPGIGERETPWPSFTGASDEFGGANPTCELCGGRARGKKKCSCDEPDWRVKGEKPDRTYGRRRQTAAYQEAMQAYFEAALRVAKPGAFLVAFGGTRTFHRLACAIEDAGWELRDTIGNAHEGRDCPWLGAWITGQGFPKSLDVSKAIDKAAGAERQVIGRGDGGMVRLNRRNAELGYRESYYADAHTNEITAPATDAAHQWQGWGTALKPAWEPIILARKPLSGTVAANVLKHGTGAINIDGCRIPIDGEADDKRLGGKGDWSSDKMAKNVYEGGYAGERVGSSPLGRWPANIVLSWSEDEYKLRSDVTPEQYKELYDWLHANA